MLKTIVLTALCAIGLSAQNTFTMPGTFSCDAVSLYPITSFYQFDCRGVPFNDSNGVRVGQVFWFSFGHFFWTFADIAQPTTNPVAKLDSFTVPSNGSPGTFQVEWQLKDANGLYHFGVWSGTWQNVRPCGGRGCQYWRPQLLSGQTTDDSSTVAILD
jgi:hypothetical protein